MKVETLNSLWYNGFTTNPNTSLKIRERRSRSHGKYYITQLPFINTARISLVIKNTNAVNANINLHLILFQVVQEVQNHFRQSKENILLAPFAVNLLFFITITTIILIIVARIKNAIIRSFKLNLL